MRLVRLSLRNFASYEDAGFVFPRGAMVIVGPNGAGKSNLARAVEFALFGDASPGSLVTDHAADTEMLVELVFEQHGETYRVRRGYSLRGRGKPVLDFDRAADVARAGEAFRVDLADDPMRFDGWVALARESVRETQRLVEDTIGVSRQVFAASVLAHERMIGGFCDAQPRERRDLLCEIIGADRYEPYAALAKQRALDCAVRVSQLDALIEQAESEAAERSLHAADHASALQRRDALSVELAAAQSRLARVDEEIAIWREENARSELLRSAERSAESRLAATKQRVDTLRARAGMLLERLSSRAEAERLAATFDGRAAALDEAREAHAAAREADGKREHAAALLRRAEHDHEAAQRAADEALAATTYAENQITALDEKNARCVLCGQRLDTAAQQEARGNLEKLGALRRDEYAAALERIGETRQAVAAAHTAAASIPKPGPLPDLAAAERRWRVALEARTTLAGLDEAAESLSHTQAELAPALEQLRDAERERDEAKRAAERASFAPAPNRSLAASDVERLAAAVRDAETLIAEANAALARIASIEQRAADHKRERDEAHEQRDTHQALARAYAPDGIPTLILETTAIPAIEDEANRVLALLDQPLSVEIVTQKALKSSDRIAEALDVLIHTPAGTTRDYARMSNGQRTRIALAVRIALARLLAASGGPALDVLLIDEPQGLDAAAQECLATLLRDVAAEMFASVLLISHDERMIDRFEQYALIDNTTGASVISTNTTRQEVAA